VFADLTDSWPLLRDAAVAAWLAAALLSVAGVLMLMRDEPFLGAALAQTSTLGIVAAPWLAAALHAEHTAMLGGAAFKYFLAVMLPAAAAVALQLVFEHREAGRSAAIAWVFLLATGLSLVIARGVPGADVELAHLLTSSTVSGTPARVALLALVLVAFTALFATSRRTVLLVTLDPSTAAAAGLRTGTWSALLAAGTGAVVGLCVPVAGTLYAFACLLLPTLVARDACREIGSMLAVAPAVAVASAVIAFLLARPLDVAPAELTVVLLALLVIPAWSLRRMRR
jgi:manganese/iron transport system permease protein